MDSFITQNLRAARALLTVGSLAALLSLGQCDAKAQQVAEVSPLAFWQHSMVAAPADRRGKRRVSTVVQVIETGRRVQMQLPPPPRFVRGRLVCAINVNRYLAQLGKPVTGSAAARSFLSYGRAADRSTAGAVQVSRRPGGHHAEIVAGGGQCWNPSASRQRWHLVACASRRNVLAWRVA